MSSASRRYSSRKNSLRSSSEHIRQLLDKYKGISACRGIGVVVPGMTDIKTGIVLRAPALGWLDVDLLGYLRKEFDNIPIHIENSGKACALSQIWETRSELHTHHDLVFVSVSDGVGVGVVINGELMRGKHNTAGEFGHLPLSIDGLPCLCGANGCWEAYISNLATISRYFGKNLSQRQPLPLETANFTIEDLVKRARSGDGKALAAFHLTARYLGLGLASIINAIDPSQIYLGGEITEAWDLIEPQVRDAIKERTTDERAWRDADPYRSGYRVSASARRGSAGYCSGFCRAESCLVCYQAPAGSRLVGLQVDRRQG